ncbi:MAG: glucose-1-phosphate adenylyltransferase subunit GlgD [Oscillospiraceae bacterium]|nr:glucose-1-phosphate adenylyltransferase subunit GlgD [Oscillospiraceae bacterium]MDY2848549.1 glucose-1-phosphate adenylyltransferase subunit GlgD [Oscillospiraceae bacterium]
MSMNKKVLGMIFANMHENTVPELTKERTMGSVMFGGRYRLIDFTLSNMVNSGIDEVGVITKSNYQSLLDHLGSGREWDLARKKGGLHLLPPFSHVTSGMYRGRLEALYGVSDFIIRSDAEYIIMSDCDVVTSMDFNPIIEQHIESGADITVVYASDVINLEDARRSTIFGIAPDGRVNDVLINPSISGAANVSLNTFILSKEFLKNLILEGAAKGLYSFEEDILRARTHQYNIIGYCHKNYYNKISSVVGYYNANMDLLDSEKRGMLFPDNAPVYTKVRDNPPAKYAIGANVRNSLVADGCIIEGTVENCILFRGARVGKGSTVRNSIIMQDSIIGAKCEINCVITDKNVRISDGRMLTGSKNYPLYIGKGAEI